MRRVTTSKMTSTQWLRRRMDSQRNRSTLQRLSFAWAMKVSQDGASRTRVARLIVFGEHPTNDIFVDLDAEGQSDLLGDAHAAEARIAPLQFNDRRDELR